MPATVIRAGVPVRRAVLLADICASCSGCHLGGVHRGRTIRSLTRASGPALPAPGHTGIERGPATIDAAAEVFVVGASRIGTAISYYGDYVDGIDAEIAGADEASARADAACRGRERGLASTGG